MRNRIAAVLLCVLALTGMAAGQESVGRVQAGMNAARRGDNARAVVAFTAALQEESEARKLAAIHGMRGDAYYQMNQLDKALADYDEAIRLHAAAGFYNNRGLAWRGKGDVALALADFDKAIALKPEAASYHNRGLGHQLLGETALAIADFKAALALDGARPMVCNDLAWLLATSSHAELRDGKQAVEYATRACDLTLWKVPDLLDTIAVAYAEAGDFANAVKCEQLTIDAYGNTAVDVAAAKARLGLFQAGKAYHEEVKK